MKANSRSSVRSSQRCSSFHKLMISPVSSSAPASSIGPLSITPSLFALNE